MSCSNCYNGCTEIVSDRCVRYTGIDVPVLGIQTGDSLSFVEQALITFLTSTLDGSGIVINLDQGVYCELVSKYLPDCGEITAAVLFEALVKAACDLQVQVTTINNTLNTLNADYSIECLTGVTPSSDTHAIVQAVITKLCQVNTTLNQLLIDLPNLYVAQADIDQIIADWVANNLVNDALSTKMVPYTAIPYFGPIAGNFDGSGAGIFGTIFYKVNLCNGNNGTPDLRGRVTVGATNGMGGPTMSPAVDPSVPGNPSYNLNSLVGSNSVSLSVSQLPAHTHTATAVVSPDPHTHTVQGYAGVDSTGNHISSAVTPIGSGTLTGATSLTVGVTNNLTGSNQPHQNYQPGIGAYYIMYIP
jgi:microcystin-dependent protein